MNSRHRRGDPSIEVAIEAAKAAFIQAYHWARDFENEANCCSQGEEYKLATLLRGKSAEKYCNAEEAKKRYIALGGKENLYDAVS